MHLLIIEDELKIANFLKKGFKEEGYTVDVAMDGEEGLYIAENNTFDAIILDLMLPKIDGITICQKIRKKNDSIPIIMLTAKSSIKDKVNGFDIGADDYLTKPFVFEELLARLRSLLRRKSSQEIKKLKVADLEMDLVTHRVYRDEKEILLSAKEYALLEYMMRNPNAIITRTMITEHVWEISYDSFTNIIDVYINYLRNKIDKDFDVKLIQTIRGRGYILKEEK
ncbi:MAG: DNA-binding response regulator [Spirochaetes bacterium GWD1_27_9]|nr:MAG: DNA-binding response regulator [Spirochaetes bacterium GWB1_27_13]OHD26494.1 MAG: DNA-binding response regulator [Spirochaetes bacterium GWC1_27_15]OHD42036.1 MAG: DNA-binding response regulator [Spirochaetes bacterium GWD1_27_9]